MSSKRSRAIRMRCGRIAYGTSRRTPIHYVCILKSNAIIPMKLTITYSASQRLKGQLQTPQILRQMVGITESNVEDQCQIDLSTRGRFLTTSMANSPSWDQLLGAPSSTNLSHRKPIHLVAEFGLYSHLRDGSWAVDFTISIRAP
jgi:hypothetical protein